MRVILCLPDLKERDFCKKRIGELAKTDCINVTIEIAEPKEMKAAAGRFTDADLIYLGFGPECDGIELAACLRRYESRADIVFFTRNRDRVFEAFDVSALHYLVDGQTSVSKFDEVFRRAKLRSAQRTQASIVLTCAGEQRKLPVSQIYYFEVINRIVTVHYAGGSFEFYSTLSKIEDSLAAKGFVRIHRAYLVSQRFIVGVSRSEVTLTDGTKLPIGGRYASNINLS